MMVQPQPQSRSRPLPQPSFMINRAIGSTIDRIALLITEERAAHQRAAHHGARP